MMTYGPVIKHVLLGRSQWQVVALWWPRFPQTVHRHELSPLGIFCKYHGMVVSITEAEGSPKWMLYNGNSY